MVLIGINGSAGAGKTTLSENLFQNCNTQVIHLDHIYDRIKELLPSSTINISVRESGETVKWMEMGTLFHKIMVSRLANRMKWLYAKEVVRRIIKKSEAEGIEYLIIEGFILEHCIDLEDLDYTIFVNTSENLRIKRVFSRNTDEELNGRINPALLYQTPADDRYSFHIENNGSYEDFINNIRQLENDILSQRNYRVKKT